MCWCAQVSIGAKRNPLPLPLRGVRLLSVCSAYPLRSLDHMTSPGKAARAEAGKSELKVETACPEVGFAFVQYSDASW